MITSQQKDTERLELPTEEILNEKESLKWLGFIRPSGTSVELPVATTSRLCSAYHPLIYAILQRFAGEGMFEYDRIGIISSKCDLLIKSMSSTSGKETSSTYPVLDLGALERLFIIRRRSEVAKFLSASSFLFLFLPEAYERIRHYFGKSAQIILEVVTDPEAAGDRELVIFIRTNLSPDEAFERLERLGEEWWLDVPFNIRKKLCIDVEFE